MDPGPGLHGSPQGQRTMRSHTLFPPGPLLRVQDRHLQRKGLDCRGPWMPEHQSGQLSSVTTKLLCLWGENLSSLSSRHFLVSSPRETGERVGTFLMPVRPNTSHKDKLSSSNLQNRDGCPEDSPPACGEESQKFTVRQAQCQGPSCSTQVWFAGTCAACPAQASSLGMCLLPCWPPSQAMPAGVPKLHKSKITGK